MTTDVIEKLDELIGATKAASVPVEFRWLDADGVAAMLGFKPRYILEKVAIRPGFPKALRLAGSGHPRWLASEVQAWAMAQRDGKTLA